MDCAFGWVETEELRRLRARCIYKSVQIQPALLDAAGVKSVHTVFDRGQPVGDLGEVIPAQPFLRGEVEGRVVGCQRADHAVAQRIPQDFPVAAVAERRRHHVLCALEVRPLSIGPVQQQVLDQRFSPDLAPTRSPGQHLAQRFLTTQMNDIHMGVQQSCESQQVMHPFGLDNRRTAFVVPFRPSLAFGQQLVLQLRDQVRVLAMGGRNDPKFLGQPQS